MRKQYKSEILAAVHETALGLHEAGVLNKVTMKTFDERCLTLVEAFGTGTNRQFRCDLLATAEL